MQSVMLAALVHIGDWSLNGPTAVRAFGFLRFGVRWMRQAVCALRGHDMVLHSSQTGCASAA